MIRLQITDNHHDWKCIQECFVDDASLGSEELDTAKKDLERIANIKIGELSLEDNTNLLVFPRDLHQYGDEISESHIISLRDDEISTGNIMGFVGVNDTQLNIKSRFAKEDGEDFFLHYMLHKVFSINLFDIKHTTRQEDIFDFLLYLFPHFLKKALAQGLFKKYRRFEYNDANIRGPIDVNRHIRENIPFRGTVAYSTREHSYDNEVTQLVRHTIEYIRTKEFGANILNNDPETKDCITQITLATQSYNVRERVKVISQNLRPVRHPYFSAYTELQNLCLRILRHESIKYGQEKDKVYGILFDGAWLWEEYLNTIFEDHCLSITHAKNKTGENGIALYERGKRCYYPDFYKRTKSAATSFVLDAKYKRLGHDVPLDEFENNISICRDDLFQMITYMHVLPANHCALLYPIERNESNTNDKAVVESKKREIRGFGGEILGYGIPIPAFNDFKECAQMWEIEKNLVSKISDWMNN